MRADEEVELAGQEGVPGGCPGGLVGEAGEVGGGVADVVGYDAEGEGLGAGGGGGGGGVVIVCVGGGCVGWAWSGRKAVGLLRGCWWGRVGGDGGWAEVEGWGGWADLHSVCACLPVAVDEDQAKEN